MVDFLDFPFGDKSGRELFLSVLDTVERYGMAEMLGGGVLLGLSGGADSVLLALFLAEYKTRLAPGMKMIAVHVNHMIRGEEANRDEEFSRLLAERFGYEFISRSIDVPELASNLGIGIEEAARNARYSVFEEIIKSRNDVSCIATAHNATDNAETVIFNLTRGSGTKGASGIAPVRGNICRPLINIEKARIKALLDQNQIDYVEDSTNESIDYSRNYIRHTILPALIKLNPRFVDAFSAFSESSRQDDELLLACAKEEFDRVFDNGIRIEALAGLHPALLHRVLCLLSRHYGAPFPTRSQTESIREHLCADNFKISISGGFSFVCERGVCCVGMEDKLDLYSFEQPLKLGSNELCGFNALVYVGNRADKTYPNVYNFSIQADLSSAIIDGELRVRFRKDGDAYYYGGMTRKLKKVFNDLDIPPSIRGRIPIICDAKGIVWVPGLGVRQDTEATRVSREDALYIGISLCDMGGEEIYFATRDPSLRIRKGLEATK
ncbi:MAG: tRNA lysidine(34) synthetase TilS [Clostridia bacterium]|nr:tRNA lysidine(34) synthetase TilS [Clostridia bacterium]